ncbi:cerebellin 18 [Engraulis encrasicolus]|uniref:cerebellin 18 n=1 Tax=Engraulis encrasicolus TaxID=184585 RepID=UPI002FCFC0C2
MKTAVAALCLLGVLCISRGAAQGAATSTTFQLMKETAVSYMGELPCGDWDCECAFKRQRGCCCVADDAMKLEDNTIERLVQIYMGIDDLANQVKEFTGPATKVAFTAMDVRLENGNNCFGPFTTEVCIPFNTISLNEGNGYKPTLGIFTAPRSGYYSFTYSIYSNVGAQGNRLYYLARLMLDGEVVASSWEDNREDSEDNASQTVVLRVRRGCQVYVQLYSGRQLCGQQPGRSTFSGFLLYPITD